MKLRLCVVTTCALILGGALVAVHARPAAAATSFTFGAAGDYGANSNATATLSLMGNSNLNFALGLGDFSYDEVTPESAWCSYVRSNIGPTLPFELIAGNHESDGAQGLIDNFAKCLPNQMSDMVGTYAKEYYFDYPVSSPLARFIMIGPGLNFTSGGPYNFTKGGADYNWVSNAIDAARAQGIQWIIVGMHKVCLTSGGSSCDIGTDLLNLLISKKVDLILEGHDHNYQRSKQLAINGTTCTGLNPTTYNAACVANNGSTSSFSQGAGSIIQVIGTGGVDDEYGAIYTNPDTPYFSVLSGTNVNPRKGFVKFSVSSAGLSAQFMGSTNTSQFTDAFTITGHPPPPGPTPTPSPTPSPTPTPTPPVSLFSNNFDGQGVGSVLVGSGTNQFTGLAGAALPTVESAVADSPQNAMASVVTGGGGGSYVYKQYGTGYTDHTLQFNIQLGTDFVLPTTDYMILAQTGPLAASLVLTGGGSLMLDYKDSAGTHHYVYSNATIAAGAWHSVTIHEIVSPTAGSLSFSVDGVVAASVSGVDTGSQPINQFSLGYLYTPADVGTAGHVFIDDVASWTPGGASSTPTPTPTPPVSPTATPPPNDNTIMSVNFDGQPAGSLQTGTSPYQFSGQSGSSRLTVENAVSNSNPNGLAVALTGGGSAYAYDQYSSGYSGHSLQFKLELGQDFVLPPADYIVLAQTLPSVGAATSAGKVSLILSGGTNSLFIDYFDSAGAQHYIYTSGSLSAGTWHTIELDEAVGMAGSITLEVDGVTVGSTSNVDTGNLPITYAAIGQEYSPIDASMAGHMYLDDVVSSYGSGIPATPTPTPTPTLAPTSTPTPTATPVITPTATPTTPPPTSTPTPAPTPTRTRVCRRPRHC